MSDPLSDFPEQDFPARQPAQAPVTPQQPQQPRAPFGFTGPRIPFTQARLPNIPVAPAGLAVPGGFAVQAAIQPAVAAVESAIAGERDPAQIGKAAAGAEAGVLGGKALGMGLNAVTSGARYAATAASREKEALKLLQDRIPGLDKAKSLKDALFGSSGYQAAHKMYDDMMADISKKAAGKTITIPFDDAKALGIKVTQTGSNLSPVARKALEAAGKLPPMPEGMASVDAADAARAVMGKSSKLPGQYKRVTQALDAADLGDPETRAAYKAWVGVRDYMAKQGALKGPKMDLVKAQQGLGTKNADILNRRGLADVPEILAPGGQQITRGNYRAPGAVVGGGIGASGLGSVVPGLGHFGGGIGGAYLGGHLGGLIPRYSGLPPSTLLQAIQSGLMRSGGAAGGALGKGL